jgi:hypothetical protein
MLPPIMEGDNPALVDIIPEQSFTQPLPATRKRLW